jgi:hypothetical protein
MTVGKDVSVLFPNVVKCMVTDNLELKKLVYLYIMNYAKSKPDLAILAVNAFVKVLCGGWRLMRSVWYGCGVGVGEEEWVLRSNEKCEMRLTKLLFYPSSPPHPLTPLPPTSPPIPPHPLTPLPPTSPPIPPHPNRIHNTQVH